MQDVQPIELRSQDDRELRNDGTRLREHGFRLGLLAV
jgi:hypothetical protein